MKSLTSIAIRMMPIIFGCSLVLITVMALVPVADVPEMFNLWDKIQHALAFSTLALTGSIAFSKHIKPLYCGLVLYGISIEIMQTVFTTTRVGEFSDVVADILGLLIGFYLSKCVHLIRNNITTK